MATKQHSTSGAGSQHSTGGAGSQHSTGAGGAKKSTAGALPIDDLTYDVVTILHNKAKGLEAYDKYMEDAGESEEVREVLETIRRDDMQHVERLRECLAELVSQESQGRGGKGGASRQASRGGEAE